MKKSTFQKWPNSAVWCVSDWVITEHQPKYTTFVPVRVGAAAATSTPSPFARSTIEAKPESTASGQRDLFDTTDSPNKTFWTT